MAVDLEESACKLLEVIPIVMQDIRSEMRNQISIDLTVSQFRVLHFVYRNEGASLWDVAHHMGLTPSAASRLVDGLIARDLMTRVDDPADRRRLQLTITDGGVTMFNVVTQEAASYLADKLRGVNADDRAIIDAAMEVLRTAFAPTTRTRVATPAASMPMSRERY